MMKGDEDEEAKGQISTDEFEVYLFNLKILTQRIDINKIKLGSCLGW